MTELPPGILDPAVLQRLANQLFTALPEHAAPAGHGVPAEGTAPVLPGSGPVVAPPQDFAAHQPPHHAVPQESGHAAPDLRTIAPPAHGIAVPSMPMPAMPVPSTPYYFVGEASAPPLPPGVAVRPDMLAPPTASQPDTVAPGQYYFVDYPQSFPEPPQLPLSESVAFDVEAVRRDFPILAERVNGRQLVWLDNAATTQKPQVVLDRLAHFYAHENSNIHRAAHELAARATDAYEAARAKVARFLGAPSSEDIVFVRGATEAINLVAQSWGRRHLGEGDEIVISQLEHHANIVPWQLITQETGATLRVAPVDDHGQLLLDAYRALLTDRTKLVSIAHVSNALGTIVPIREVIEAAHSVGARVLIDGAQAVAHLRVNVQALDPDFYVFSGHKIFAPTGIGVLYGKADVLESMPPWQGGGNMIKDVTFERSTFQPAPGRFEAGTGNIADAVGLGAALDYLERLGLENVARYEHDLLEYATQGMLTVPGLELVGTAPEKTSVLSFVLAGYRPEDVGSALNQEGIAVRAGHHCAQPILRHCGYEATVRPSLAMYNTCAEVDQLVAALHRLAADAGRTR